jgi:nucleoid-associated protein YgaU
VAFASAWLVVGIVVPAAVRHLSSVTADQSTVTAGGGATSSAADVQAASPSPEVSPGPAPVTGAMGSARTHVVRPGDTLWAIARKIKPEGDPRPIVDELARRTGGRPLQPGQRIALDALDK